MGTVTLNLRPAAEGDPAAQAVLYERLYRELSPYAAIRAHWVRQFWEGADLLQHVFSKLLFCPKTLAGFTSGSALREYARRSIDNQCRDIARSRAYRGVTMRGEPESESGNNRADLAEDWPDDLTREIDRECLRRAIGLAATADPEGFALLRLAHACSSDHAAKERSVSVRTVQRRIGEFSRLVTAYYHRLQA